VHLLVAGNEQAVPDILDGVGPVRASRETTSRETTSRETGGHDGR
jgi:hypothetical protein